MYVCVCVRVLEALRQPSLSFSHFCFLSCRFSYHLQPCALKSKILTTSQRNNNKRKKKTTTKTMKGVFFRVFGMKKPLVVLMLLERHTIHRHLACFFTLLWSRVRLGKRIRKKKEKEMPTRSSFCVSSRCFFFSPFPLVVSFFLCAFPGCSRSTAFFFLFFLVCREEQV